MNVLGQANLVHECACRWSIISGLGELQPRVFAGDMVDSACQDSTVQARLNPLLKSISLRGFSKGRPVQKPSDQGRGKTRKR